MRDVFTHTKLLNYKKAGLIIYKQCSMRVYQVKIFQLAKQRQECLSVMINRARRSNVLVQVIQ